MNPFSTYKNENLSAKFHFQHAKIRQYNYVYQMKQTTRQQYTKVLLTADVIAYSRIVRGCKSDTWWNSKREQLP